MEMKWLEDFLSLAETGSFSRSAEHRHVTQPAFSRRIRALEAWVGAPLIDRTSYPTKLTAAGEAFREHAVEVLHELHEARAVVKGSRPIAADTLQFAVPHALSLGFYPRWLSRVQRDFGVFASKLAALNVHDAVMALVEDHRDLLMAYHHAQQPIRLDPERYAHLSIGWETIRPYSKATRSGAPMFKLPGSPAHPVPYLAYSPGAFLGRVVDVILSSSRVPHHLLRRYETDMAEALKVMAVEGHGVAWLPDSALGAGPRTRSLVPAGPALWEARIEIRLYRDRTVSKPLLDRLWQRVERMYAKKA